MFAVTGAPDVCPPTRPQRTRHGWILVPSGLGDADLDGCFRTLNQIGYEDPISIEWEDSGMDHLASVPLVLTYAREHVHNLPAAAFDVLLRVLDRRKGPPVESVIDSHNVTD